MCGPWSTWNDLRARRLAGLDVIERDDVLDGAHRRVQVGRRPEGRPHACDAVRGGTQRPSLARRHEHGRLPLEPVGFARAGALEDEDERVVQLVAEVERGAWLETQMVEGELRAALGRHERSTFDAVRDDRIRPVWVLHAPHGGSIGSEPRAKGAVRCR